MSSFSQSYVICSPSPVDNGSVIREKAMYVCGLLHRHAFHSHSGTSRCNDGAQNHGNRGGNDGTWWQHYLYVPPLGNFKCIRCFGPRVGTHVTFAHQKLYRSIQMQQYLRLQRIVGKVYVSAEHKDFEDFLKFSQNHSRFVINSMRLKQHERGKMLENVAFIFSGKYSKFLVRCSCGE